MNRYKEPLMLLLHIISGGYLSFRKITNFVLSIIHPFVKNYISTGYPPVYAIDPSASCNISCFICPAGRQNQNTSLKNMSFAKYEKLVDEIQDHAIAFFFYVIGEPFMNKAVYKMIEYAHNYKVFTILSTNGQLINTQEKAEKLVKKGLDHLIVTISGVTQKTHSKYHVYGNIDQVFNNIKMITAVKRRLNSKSPHITLRYVRFTYNMDEALELEKIRRKLGVNSISIRDGRVNTGKGDLPASVEKKLADYLKYCITEKKEIVNRRNACYWPWSIGVVAWDGSLAPCTQFPWIESEKAKNYLGNVFKAGSFKKIWQGQKMLEFRKSMLNNNQKPSFCKSCIRNVGFGDKT